MRKPGAAGVGEARVRSQRFRRGSYRPRPKAELPKADASGVQAEDGVLSCRRSANPNDETERQLTGPQRAVGNGLFRGYSKKTGISVDSSFI